MNYKELYYKFIAKFKEQEISENTYTEVHHILPRYCGGDDSEENLVKLTYRQHVFVHHLWFKATGDLEAEVAYKLMSGISKDKRLEISRLGGLVNKRNGWLDKIRPLANTKVRQEKLRKLHEEMRGDGRLEKHIKLAQAAWKESHHTEEYKKNKSEEYKKKFKEDLEYKNKILEIQKLGVKKRSELSADFSKQVILNAIRNEEFLNKTSNKSSNYFISPEGLVFESPIFAANYYGNVKPHTIENWCKREQYGWKRTPKSGTSVTNLCEYKRQ